MLGGPGDVPAAVLEVVQVVGGGLEFVHALVVGLETVLLALFTHLVQEHTRLDGLLGVEDLLGVDGTRSHCLYHHLRVKGVLLGLILLVVEECVEVVVAIGAPTVVQL